MHLLFLCLNTHRHLDGSSSFSLFCLIFNNHKDGCFILLKNTIILHYLRYICENLKWKINSYEGGGGRTDFFHCFFAICLQKILSDGGKKGFNSSYFSLHYSLFVLCASLLPNYLENFWIQFNHAWKTLLCQWLQQWRQQIKKNGNLGYVTYTRAILELQDAHATPLSN